MQRTLIYLGICLALASLAAHHERRFEGRVVAVKDGDTLEVMRGKKPVRVRLAEIDCPEKKQAFGSRAKQFASQLVFGQRVRVVVKNKDRYGRSVAEVFLSDGRCLNAELVKAGLAWRYRQYSRNPLYAILETEARDAGRGLWSEKNPTPPWEYRTAMRRQ